MSHTTTIELEVKDLDALREACRSLALEYAENVTVDLYDGTRVENCFSVKLPGWRFPAVFKDGRVHYDNYEGAWGKQAEFDRLRQRYSTNVQIATAKRKGYRVREEQVGGKVKLILER